MSSSSTEQETSNSSTSEDGKNINLNSLMNGKNRNSSNSSNGKKSPIKQPNTSPQQQQNRCTWCAETKQPLRYILPTQNGKKEFCSETCIAEFRKAYNKGACKECDNAIRGNAPNRDFCSTYCLNKNNKKKQQQSAPSTSQSKTINNNNNSIENNNNSKQKSSSSSSGAVAATTAIETNNNNTLIKEHYAMTKISPMFQYEAFHVFDWNEYLKVSEK